MLWMLVRRAGFSVVALLVVSFILFVLTRVVPGSPALTVLSNEAPQTAIDAFERHLGLDKPILDQYVVWLGNVLEADLGKSYVTGLPIADTLAESLPITLELVILSFVFAVVASVPLGMISALNQGSWIDHLTRIVAVTGISVPVFWVGLMAIVLLAVGLGWFPPGGFIPLSAGLWPHVLVLVLPVFSLGFHYVSELSRLTRSSMLEALSQDYVRTARAMGLSRPRVWWYALKNALAPVVNVAAMIFGYSFGAAVIIEFVFAIPGLSRTLLDAINQRDYPMIQMTVLVVTAVFILANLVADLLNVALNPKLRRKGA